MPRVVCISDTHQQEEKLVVPDGDILIHAGDITYNGSLEAMKRFNNWLGKLPHKHKIVICGNHDWCFQKPSEKQWARHYTSNATYLEDSGVEVEGLKIWGSPWQPWFHSWAFNLERGEEIREKWGLIPSDTDILVTHGPPFGYGDKTQRGERVGCEDLLLRIKEIKPKLHVFGHIHEDPGMWGDPVIGTWYVNASSCNLQYNPVNPPIVVDIDAKKSQDPV